MIDEEDLRVLAEEYQVVEDLVALEADQAVEEDKRRESGHNLFLEVRHFT